MAPKRAYIGSRLAGSLIAFGVTMLISNAGATELECERQVLDPEPSWISSAAVLAGGDILVADPPAEGGRLIRYNSHFTASRIFDDWRDFAASPGQRQPDERFRPTAFQIFPDRSIRLVAKGFDPIRISASEPALSLDGYPRQSAAPIAGSESAVFYSNAQLLDANTLVGYGALVQNYETESESFELGFIVSRLGEGSSDIEESSMPLPYPDNDFYLLGYPYVAIADEIAFAVTMSEPEPNLVQVFPEPLPARDQTRFADAIPKRFKIIPTLPTKKQGSDNMKSVFMTLEESTMVAGLYAQGSTLFLLTRDGTGGKTEWLVHPIDSKTGKRFPPLRLPTETDHLTIAIGNSFWYLFERESLPTGRQSISSVAILPSSWLVNFDEPRLRMDHPRVDCN